MHAPAQPLTLDQSYSTLVKQFPPALPRFRQSDNSHSRRPSGLDIGDRVANEDAAACVNA